MAAKKSKKAKKRKKFPLNIILALALAALFFWFLFFRFEQKKPDVYIFPENPKQGDTVLIIISGESGNVSGNFGEEKLDFFRKNKSELISFLGIDAKTKPGKYKISLRAREGKLEEEINIAKADFPSYTLVIPKELKNKGYNAEKVVENTIKETSILDKLISIFTDEPYFTKPFSFPLEKMDRSGFTFGEFVKSSGYKLQHFGIDLAAQLGTPVYAINDGKVVFAESLSDYGKTIVIDHGLGIFSMYLHLSHFKVSQGQLAVQGQIIALSGNTGYSTAPHLHFSMRAGGARIDPIAFIKTTKQTENNLNLADIGRALLKFVNNFISGL